MKKITFEDLPSTNTPINSTNLNKLQDNVENAINGTTLYENLNGTQEDFTLSDSYKNYKKIDIVYGYASWVQTNYIHSFDPELTKAVTLTICYTFTNSAVRIANCGLNFSGTSVAFDTARNMQVDMTSSGVSSSSTENKLAIYKVIGYN